MKPYSKLLRMDKTGHWSHGIAATRWMIHPTEIKHGWLVHNGAYTPLKQVLASISQPLPKRPRRKHTIQMLQFVLRSPDQTVTYETVSIGGMMTGHALIKTILAQAERGATKLCPIVRLRSKSYRHVKYGTIYLPDFVIVGWTDLGGDGKKRRPSQHDHKQEKEARV
jgi:hypothetical protein